MLLLSAVIACGFAQTSEGTFDSNGVKIRYATAGEGETVVLIHGWMGDATMWGRDASGNPRLDAASAPGFRLVAIDCRGHGRSDKPHDKANYGAEMAADVVRLLDHLKVKKAHLVGYSMGAFIAGKVAATQPERVSSLFYGGQAPLLAGADNSSKEVEIFAKLAAEGKDLGEYFLAVMPPDRVKLTPEAASALAKMMFNGKDVKAFAAAGRSFGDLSVRLEDLKKCPAPMLFVYGSREAESTKARVEEIRKGLGRGEVKVIEGADHVTTPAKAAFGISLIGFLNANRGK